jgi:alkylation response protein AidB-like acyl-CoA dehydrogenase
VSSAPAGGDPAALAPVLDGLENFLVSEVDKLHADNAWLDDQRQVYDPQGRYTPAVLDLIRRVRTRSATAGYYTMALPSSIGGSGLGFLGAFLAWERLFMHCGPKRWLGHYAIAHWSKGPNPLLRHAPQAVRDVVLPGLISGEQSMCFAMSEPEAGSDVWMLRTRAERVDGGWRINGAKQWISNGTNADWAIVVAVTDPEAVAARRGGVGSFLVDTSTPGFVRAGVSPMFGTIGSDEATLHLDDVFVPEQNVLGDPAKGLTVAMEGVSFGRVYNCAKAVGIGTWAFRKSLDHAPIRHSFGRPLTEHQAIGFGLADSAIELHGARLVAVDVAQRLDTGLPARKELAMAKVAATAAGLAAVDRAVQSHGALGFTNETGLPKAWQMLRALGVADGTDEILRKQVLDRLLKGDVVL